MLTKLAIGCPPLISFGDSFEDHLVKMTHLNALPDLDDILKAYDISMMQEPIYKS